MPRNGSKPPMSSATALPWLCVAAVAIGLAFTSLASAQTAPDARGQAAYAEWRRLSQTEVNCADRTFRAQGTTLWIMIQRGMYPSNPAAARIRAACRTQAQNQVPTQVVAQAPTPAQPKAPTATAPNASQALASASEPAAEKAEADRAVAAKAAADKVAADRAATAKAVAEKLEADKVLIAKAADKPDKATAAKPEPENTAAAKAAAEKLEADRTAEAKAAADKAARAEADKKAAEKSALVVAKADAARAQALIQVQNEAAKEQADAERARNAADAARLEAVKADAAPASAAELRMSFIYGLFCGPLLFGLGGLAFLCFHRRRTAAPHADGVGYDKLAEIHRLVKVVLSETERREKASAGYLQPERTLPERPKAPEEPAFH